MSALALIVALAACGSDSTSDADATSDTDAAADTGATPDGPQVMLYRSPTCGCCAQYEEYLKDEGFAVESEIVDDMATIKERHGVPADAEACHTSLIGDYVVEGHVPIEVIEKLLDEQPDIDGIALPGMPSGSPGMGGEKDGPWEILSIEDGTTTEPYMTL